MDAKNADVPLPTAEEVAAAIAEIEAEEEAHVETELGSQKYQRRLDEHYSNLIGTKLLGEATRDAMFASEEAQEFSELTTASANQVRQGKELSPSATKRLKELDARTHVIPLVFRKLRNAFLSDSSADEITQLVSDAQQVARTWNGSETVNSMRVLAAVGKLAAGCTLLHGDGEEARETLRKIIALEIEPDEGSQRGSGLYSFWNVQLNTIYGEDDARRRSSASHVEKDRKTVERERRKAEQGNSPDK